MKIATIEYNNLNLIFVSDYYDIPLNGTCYYNNNICEFKTIVGDWDGVKKEWLPSYFEIYQLTWIGKIKWVWTQWLFEFCVGYHYSHRNKLIYIRKSKWLSDKLYKWYYEK